jgi:hypothetical protein
MSEDPYAAMRRWHRQDYLRRHELQRRANLKTQGSRRIDITLNPETLDNLDTIRRYLKAINRHIDNNPKIPRRLRQQISYTEIITSALRIAADHLEEEDAKAAKQWPKNFPLRLAFRKYPGRE